MQQGLGFGFGFNALEIITDSELADECFLNRKDAEIAEFSLLNHLSELSVLAVYETLRSIQQWLQERRIQSRWGGVGVRIGFFGA